MSARPSQGSASFTIVLGAMASLVVGGLLLTFVVYPVLNNFTAAAFWSAETTAGANLLTTVSGIWTFWGAIVLIAILAFIWVKTRQ